MSPRNTTKRRAIKKTAGKPVRRTTIVRRTAPKQLIPEGYKELVVHIGFVLFAFFVLWKSATGFLSIDPTVISAAYSRLALSATASFFERMNLLGQVVFPWISMLFFMLISQQLWRYRMNKIGVKHTHKGVENWIRQLLKAENLLNDFVIVVLKVVTYLIAIFAFFLIVFARPENDMVFYLVRLMVVGQNLANWITILAMITILRELKLLLGDR